MSSQRHETTQFDRPNSSYIPGSFDTDYEGTYGEVTGGASSLTHANGGHSNNRHHLNEAGPLETSVIVPSTARDLIKSDLNNNGHDSIYDSRFGPDQSDSTKMEGHHYAGENNTVLEEAEMNRKLGDFESSFIPELSHLSLPQSSGPEPHANQDFHDYERDNDNLAKRRLNSTENPFISLPAAHGVGSSPLSIQSPKTPPGMYQTPAPERQELRQGSARDNTFLTPELPSTSQLEFLSSSPTAARTVSRVQSMATIGGYETADEHDFPESPTKKAPRHSDDPEATPRKNNALNSSQTTINTTIGKDSTSDVPPTPSSQSRRPKYLNSRSAGSRLSYDSVASSATDASDNTLGADFALQSGGALPEPRLQRKPRMTLSRSTSLGSIVSGVSNLSDDEGNSNRRVVAEAPELGTLEEESPKHNKARGPSPNSASVVTPRPSTVNLNIPSETVITNRVRDLEVPGSFAKQYRQSQNVGMSPGKTVGMAAMTPSTKKGLTLKEHRSTVEKLGKENFDLKMKIHFLDQALQRRSEDGIKEMITENVQLKSDRMRLEKENHGLRKQVRELQKKIDNTGGKEEDQGYGTDEDRRSPTAEEELMYLREKVEMNEVEISRMRKERMERESEKRKLAEMVRSLGDRNGTGSDVGSREERDMWKDMLEAETIAREQSEDECKKLRDEIAKLRQETFNAGSKLKKTRMGGSVVSRSSSVEGSVVLRNDNAETERLRHEVSELQKMIGAQASTLTSRNKEKERLYQEIEDLKLGRMGGLRSVAGDSILDRSASRARSNSRASNGTRFSRLSEPEREQFEARVGELRDEVSQLRLDNQNLQSQFEEALAELDAVDAQAQADADQFNEELLLLTQERDNALRDADAQDQAFQQLKEEAQEEIDGLGDELDAKVEECERLEQELKAHAESVNTLQAEMRSASEGLIRLEQDAQQNLARYQSVKSELEDSTRELENMEKSLAEAENKVERLTVQQESSHNEIAFLREEQDGDKIKIGDLESLLKKVHLNLDSERDRAKDLERRLTEERQQREAVSDKEKQDVQQMLNDLNREASTAKDELRRVKKGLSSREIEVTTYKEKLTELEESLRHILRDPNATRSSLIGTVTKIQRELDQHVVDLDQARQSLEEHQNLLSNRNVLLESSSLEYRKLTELLERERQARRQDKHSFEQSLKSHQQSARALSANNARITELEQARHGHRKQLSQLESQYKDQLAERNQVLLNLWKKLSALCGPDWAYNHSLINGNLPSQEVVGNMLFWPGFSRNLLLAAKQVEGTLASTKDKIKKVDRELTKEYHNLEQMLEARTKKLDRIEDSWEKMKLRLQELEAGIVPPSHIHHNNAHRNASRASMSHGQQSATPAFEKIKAENRLLKAELQLLQRQQSNIASQDRAQNRNGSRVSVISGGAQSHDGAMSLDGAASVTNGGIPVRTTSMHHRVTAARANANSIDERLASSEDHHSQHEAANGEYNAFPERAAGTLMIPAQPAIDPRSMSNGNFLRSPVHQEIPTSAISAPGASSDAGTVTTAALLGMGQERWIHRLRELERRLKAEREQRLIDRSGMRKRLEEREAVNESLRQELERERVRRSWAEGDEHNEDVASAAMAVGNIIDHGSAEDSDRDLRSRGRERDHGIGRISVNNRVVDVTGDANETDGSSARSSDRGKAR